MYQNRFAIFLRNSVLLSALTLVLLSTSVVRSAPPAQPLTVTASPVEYRGHLALQFSVRNDLAHSLALRQDQLPWDGQFSAIVVAVNKINGEPLKRTPRIEDTFGPAPLLQLTPGTSLSGKLELAFAFARFSETQKQGNLLVLWFYAPRAADGTPLGKYGGWLEF